jgi:NTP pyrophosphatase (non-canonical NTP hydrolase)
MDFNEYQDGVKRTWRAALPDLTDRQIKLLFAIVGLAGELGELAEMAKKAIFHGMPEMLAPDKTKKEGGDILWYLTAAMDTEGHTMEDVAETNNRKLRARYPEGFVEGGGIRTGEGA